MKSNENEPTWIKNPHGVKSCMPKRLADKFVSTRVGWSYTTAEYVPEKKAFPMCEEMSPVGISRRGAINERATTNPKIVEAASETPLALLKEEAKGLKIRGAATMKAETLVNRIAEAKAISFNEQD